MRNHNGRLPKNNHQSRSVRYRRNSDPVQQRLEHTGDPLVFTAHWAYPNPRTAVAQAKPVQHAERLVKAAPDPRSQPAPVAKKSTRPARPQSQGWHAYRAAMGAGAL